MTERRDFLKVIAWAAAQGVPASTMLQRARLDVRTGTLGTIQFCRVQHAELVPALQFVLDGAECIIEVDPARHGAAVLGSDATLVLDQSGYRRFGRDG